MNPIRVMSRLTQQAAQDGTGSGPGEYDLATCASLCRGMKRPPYLTARLIWCLDWSVCNELEHLLWMEAASLAAKERWKIPKGKEYVRRMAGLAIAESADPKRWRFASQRAEFAGISDSEWSRTWRARYEAVYEILTDWSADAFRHIQKAQLRWLAEVDC